MAINRDNTVDGLHSHHHHTQTTPASSPSPLPCNKDVGSITRDDGTGEKGTKGRPRKWESRQRASAAASWARRPPALRAPPSPRRRLPRRRTPATSPARAPDDTRNDTRHVTRHVTRTHPPFPDPATATHHMCTSFGGPMSSKLSPRENGPCSTAACPPHTRRPRTTRSGPTTVVGAARRKGCRRRRGPRGRQAPARRARGPHALAPARKGAAGARAGLELVARAALVGGARGGTYLREQVLTEVVQAAVSLADTPRPKNADTVIMGLTAACASAAGRHQTVYMHKGTAILQFLRHGDAKVLTAAPARHAETHQRGCCEYGPYGGMYQCRRATPHRLHAPGNCNIAVPAAWRR
ncbi:hypothetical protein BJ912DRAFT_1060321 [Pholiota molesta]|nr:hypothetical protein BJ912DRAFT_1060321 [Pholiota molesta]